jgi:hypothetical protein
MKINNTPLLTLFLVTASRGKMVLDLIGKPV